MGRPAGRPYDFRNLLMSRWIWVESQSRSGISASGPLMSTTFLVKAFTGSGGGSFLNGACSSSLLMSNRRTRRGSRHGKTPFRGSYPELSPSSVSRFRFFHHPTSPATPAIRALRRNSNRASRKSHIGEASFLRGRWGVGGRKPVVLPKIHDRSVSKISISLVREEAVVTESVENAALDWRASHPPEAVFRRLALLLVVLLSFPYRFVSRFPSISDPRRDEVDHEPHNEDDDWHTQRLGLSSQPHAGLNWFGRWAGAPE